MQTKQNFIMTLDIPEINLKGGPREQRRTAAVVAAISSELNIRTQEKGIW